VFKEDFMYQSTGLVACGSTVLAFAFLSFAFPWSNGAQKNAGGESNGWRVAEPIRYENLTVFPIVSRQSADTTGFATLDDGLSAGQVVISEGGSEMIRRSRDGRPMGIPEQRGASVNQLVLINRGSKPLLLLAGELVSGGKQDRIIGKDRIVPPGAAPLPLDVFCVEAGRWSAGAQFSAGKLMVHPSVREQAAVTQEQAKVWDAVRSGTPGASPSSRRAIDGPPPARAGQASESVAVTLSALAGVIAAAAPTQSYAKVYNSPQVGVPADAFAEEVQRRFERATEKLKGESVVGVIVAYDGEVAWSDVFASPSLFERYWPKLLRSYVVEALVRPKGSEQPSIDDAREFLKPLVGHESIESEPATYSLRQVTEGKFVEMELKALRPQELTLHFLKVHRTS
jgi:hypothetical protein